MLCTISVNNFCGRRWRSPFSDPSRASSLRYVCGRQEDLSAGFSTALPSCPLVPPNLWTIFRPSPRPVHNHPAPDRRLRPKAPSLRLLRGACSAVPGTPPKVAWHRQVKPNGFFGKSLRPTLRIRFLKNIPASSPPSRSAPRSAQNPSLGIFDPKTTAVQIEMCCPTVASLTA